MSLFSDQGPVFQQLPHNQPEFTVSEISSALKTTIENAFGYVRVRGEISGCKLAPSGHLYLSLKDENALLASIMWRGVVQKLPYKPTDGMEVICTGRITTYVGQSKYQLIIESMQPAGEGALMAVLEKRKQQLQAEGLFDSTRKKKLPFFPKVIGVVTSPTGAVIRDILHRLEDRFPCHVLVWPVLVQGEQAAGQIAEAIKGFNRLAVDGEVPRPDVLIVARGGGSLEDLWAFNEEIVVRSAAASLIPLISAVGHETDTTLIDYAADVRAPTPTAAAEMATPVRGELLMGLGETARRMMHGALRLVSEKQSNLLGLKRGLPNPALLLEQSIQRLDDSTMRLCQATVRIVEFKRKHISEVAAAIPHPRYVVEVVGQRLMFLSGMLNQLLVPLLNVRSHGLAVLQARLSGLPLRKEILVLWGRALELEERYHKMMRNILIHQQERLQGITSLLECYHYKKVLERGFVLIRDAHNKPVTSALAAVPGEMLTLEFKDGERQVEVVKKRN